MTKTNRGNVVLDELHRVVNSEQCRDVATRTVDVDVDVLIGVFALKVNQLCAHQVRDGVVDGCANEKNVFLEQTAVQVVRALTAAGLFDNCRNVIVDCLEVHGVPISRFRRDRGLNDHGLNDRALRDRDRDCDRPQSGQ